ncbi:hypothetical protein FVF58_04165 [Paraburkholderia panacisoli]|uniref:Uncharacterized protein n=1 Tax=Paraburkholderia panacisoli TaxID=2603818 RepID=A0A5B0HJX8_9BURK|nr:hypothetical protein [Paraburkholderia panacisoli]KAA1015123.1 hypothetical protein FVF58_04165 [Paraburkholderia panacisoli]
MSALYIHIETIFGEPGFVVLRTSMTPHEPPVVMLVRTEELDDSVLTMLDALDTTDNLPPLAVGKRAKKDGRYE